MQLALRKSVPARVTAVGFIVCILFGNIWLVDMILGTVVSEWVRNGFFAGFSVAALGGVAMLFWTLLSLGGIPEVDETDTNDNDLMDDTDVNHDR